MGPNDQAFGTDLVGAEQPFNQIVTVTLGDARIVSARVDALEDSAFSDEAFPRDKPPDDERPSEEGPAAKIHPVLETWLRERSPDRRELLLVNLDDDVTIPRFPDPQFGEPRTRKPIRRS